MSTIDIDRLRRLLGGADTRWVLERVRRRLERGLPLTGPITLTDATPEQRRAIESLLGRPPRLGPSLTVPLADLDAVIRRSGVHSGGLGSAVVELTGAVAVLSEVRARGEDEWARALAPLVEVVARSPELSSWYGQVQARGLLKRVCSTPAAAVPVAVAAARLLSLLPAAGVGLSQLATEIADDAHALDYGRPLSTIALSAIRSVWWFGGAEVFSPAQRRRGLWDCVGVTTDEVSSTVLVLNIRTSRHPEPLPGLARILVAAAEFGEPVVLTLRQLIRQVTQFEPGPVFICENPAVVLAAANELGPTCPPLVCCGGQPTAAVLRLLSQLAEAGCSLHYHGDFDWGGIRIANLLWRRYPMRSWRFDASSYLGRAPQRGATLLGKAVDADWDPDLRQAIARHGVRVEEEAVLGDLLADLAEAARD